MKTLFSREMLAKCVASVDEVDEAKRCGEKIVMGTLEATVTAYLWRGKTYIDSIEIKPT